MTAVRPARRYFLLSAIALALTFAEAASASVRVPLSGWNWGNPTPQGNDLRAIDFIGARGYAVGNAGTALRTDDGGSTWSGLATGTPGNLTKLQIVDPETLVVLGVDGCILRRSANGGATFTRIFIVAETACPDRVRAFHFVDRNVGYLLLADGSVLRTADAGASFSKQTALPGTAASATGGAAQPADILTTGPDSAIAFATAGQGPSLAYTTTDAGVSWKPLLTIASGVVTQLYRYDPMTIYAIGPSTLLRSTDGGVTFDERPFGAGKRLTSIRCADAQTCLITTDKGELNRTTDAGATATPITASSVPLAGAAFASAARAVAVGVAGKTVVSDDGGVNYVAIGGDVGGNFFRLREGPVPTSAFAPGAKGQVAFTADGGVTWKVANVSTSSDLADTSWPDLKTGYAIDRRGGLFRTANGGVSWATLSPGAGAPANAVLALPGGDVLLFGPRGVKRATGGGEFNPVSGGLVSKTALTDAQLAGSAIFAWARGGKTLLASTTKGATWKVVRLPSKKTRIRSVSFTSRQLGRVLDAQGRLWSTANGGSSWKESLSTGTAQATSVAFGSSRSGYLSVGRFGDSTGAYVLRTTDGGTTWRPQSISPSTLVGDGIVAPDATHAFGLVGAGTAWRQFFFTTTGGDAGAASSLTLKASPSGFTKKSLKKAKGRITISGKLAGAVGGERITIAARGRNGADWTSRTVTAGANGGSFSATFTMKNRAVFVAQWAGDSGRAGVGSKPLLVNVR
jgi:photosystem II stability/assembly factor-like uncharacterized protein